MFFALWNRRERCYSLTTDDRSAHLYTRPYQNVGVNARYIITIPSKFDQIYQADHGDDGDAISEICVNAEPDLNLDEGNLTKKTTYKPPIANIAVSTIFRDLCIRRFQINGTGKPNNTTSVTIWGIDEPT